MGRKQIKINCLLAGQSLSASSSSSCSPLLLLLLPPLLLLLLQESEWVQATCFSAAVEGLRVKQCSMLLAYTTQLSPRGTPDNPCSRSAILPPPPPPFPCSQLLHKNDKGKEFLLTLVMKYCDRLTCLCCRAADQDDDVQQPLSIGIVDQHFDNSGTCVQANWFATDVHPPAAKSVQR